MFLAPYGESMFDKEVLTNVLLMALCSVYILFMHAYKKRSCVAQHEMRSFTLLTLLRNTHS